MDCESSCGRKFGVCVSYCTHYKVCRDEKSEHNRISKPMLWIGFYVAAASVVCSLAVAADVFRGFRHKKLWFPCRFFTLNAATLTLLAVAVKLPMDLNNPMPGEIDQLAKLSGTVFMCTAMANFMPSLALKDAKDIFMNITALGIFLITLVVNVRIQLSTGVIFIFRKEQVIVLISMLLLFVIMSFSALTVQTTKKYLERKYFEIHNMILIEESEETRKSTVEKLKEDVEKYQMMAETGNVQFVMARSATCTASCAICCLTALILAQALVRSILFTGKYFVFSSWSDYIIATSFIAMIQIIGVALSTIAPTIRWFTAVKFKCLKKRGKSYKSDFKIEKYWIERLVEWKESPSVLQIRSQKWRKLVHYTKALILGFCIRIQIVIVVASKSIQLISTFFMMPFLSCCQYVTGFWKKLQSIALNNGLGSKSESKHGSKLDLSRYVLHLEGEEKLAQWIMTNGDTTNRLIQIGRKQRPKHVEELLQKSTGFKGVAEFDNDEVPSLNFQEPPNCWSLPVTTLASIAMALPNIKNHMVDQLIQSVGQGLFYARLVEDVLYTKGDFINIRNAAEKVWLDVELFRKWLNEDLRKMALEGKSSQEVLGELVDIAKSSVIEFKTNNENLKEDHVNWPAKVIAANSMYRMSQSILLNY